MGNTPFKFAIMLNRMQLYPWQIKVYEEIMQTGLATCELLIVKEEENIPRRSFIQKLTQPYLLFEQFKKRKLNTGLYRPTGYKPIENIDTIKVSAIKQGKASESFNEKDVELIRSKNLDFIVRFGFGILKGDILSSAKWGIWSYHHADEQEFRGGPPGFWEIFKGAKLQGVILQQLTEKLDAGKIILKRHYAVSYSSYTDHVTKLFQESTDMPAQALRMIHAGVIDPGSWNPVKTTAPIYRYPKNLQFLFFILIIIRNKIRLKWWVWFKLENWIIGYKTTTDKNYKYVSPNKEGEYLADPFCFYEGEQPLILAEHYSYHTEKGHIVLIEPGMNQITSVIEKNTHLSYPFVYEENGNIYIIPEESETGKLNLYKWDREKKSAICLQTLMDIPAVDASLLKHGNKYYLFTGIKGQAPNEKLFIFCADQLEGPYSPHVSNPVKVSPMGARMGGGFMVDGEKIIRPSQYSVQHYGEKIVFQRIVKLSPTEYEEEWTEELKPMKDAPFNCGLHTYDKKGTFEVIDLKTRRSGFTAFKARL